MPQAPGGTVDLVAGPPRLDVPTWIGFLAPAGTPAAFTAKIRADLDKWGAVTRRLGIRPQ